MRDVDPTRPWTRLYPDRVPNELPIPTESMADVLEATARVAGEAPAIHYFDATISYARLDDLASRFATLLASWGVGHGDRVALYLQNVPQYFIALYGIWKRGAIAVPLNPMFKDRELAYHLEDSGARVLVALESLYEGVARAVVPGSKVENVVTTSELDMLGSEPPAAVFAASKKAAPAGTVDMLPALDRTTADPKARLPVAPDHL